MAALAVTSRSPTFLFATCNPGWESALKAEMRTRHGETITPAFLRPGLVTWKVREETSPSLVGPLPVLAHVSGYSLGMAKTLEELPEIAGRCGMMPDRIHVFPRVLPEDGFTAEEWDAIDARAHEILSFLRESGPNVDFSPPRHRDLVLDVILGEEGEALFVGWHRHDRFRFPFPGGMPRAILPDDAPRAPG